MERKRKALSLETKYEIINEFEKSGQSKIEIADETIFKSLNTVEIAVSTSKQTQTSILDFFKPT